MATPKKVTELTESTNPQLTHYIPVHDGTGLKKVLLSYIKTLVSSAAATWGNITGTLSNQTDLQNALNAKQASLGFTPENEANKKLNLSDNSDTYYPTQKAVKTAVDAKQDTLVSGTNIKTINNTSLLGSGDITIASGGITIDTTPITGGGSGRILFESATGKVSESVNLVYDGRLAIGSPGAYGSGNRLAIKAGATGDYIIHVESTGSGVFMAIKTSSGVAEYGIYQNALYFQSLPGLSGGVTFYDDSSTSIPALQSKGGKLGIGVPISGTISARVHIISTTEQMRTGYDASNYESKTVGSTGVVTYDAVGSGAKFKFMKPINLQNLPTSAAGLSSGDVWNDSGTLKIV